MFKPNKYYKSIFDVNFELLHQEGIKLIACDLDNTLVPHDVADASLEVIELINKVKLLGFEIIVMSNNHKSRVERFCKPLDIKYYYSSKKPLKTTFKKALRDFKVTNAEFCLIGDQIMTDVFGASRMKVMSVFVEPLAKKDIVYTKVNRIMENIIIKRLEKKNLFKRGEYYE